MVMYFMYEFRYLCNVQTKLEKSLALKNTFVAIACVIIERVRRS